MAATLAARRRRRNDPRGNARKEPEMAWTLKGHMTENCSCNMFCPCWFGVQEYMIMDQGWCDTSITWEIE
jgi:hypothetical protein